MRTAPVSVVTIMLLLGCSSSPSSSPGTGGGGGSTTASTGGVGGGTGGSGGSTGGTGGSTAGTGGNRDSGSGPRDSAPDAARADRRPDAPSMDGMSTDAPRDGVNAGLSSSRQVARPRGMPFAGNGYYEYLPPGYGDGTRRPLLMFWHGVGENGDGSLAQLPFLLRHGPPKIIGNDQWSNDYPFIVLSIQHAPPLCPTAAEVRDFMTFAMGMYNVDPDKVFLTGLSCGGTGSFDYLGQFKGERVLAAALIASDSSRAFNAAGCSLLSEVALWVFHGTADAPANDTAGMTNFMACPQPRKDARYELLQGAGHVQSWERVYDNPAKLDEILTWMLAQTRAPAAP